MKKIEDNDIVVYQCEECGFHYVNKEWAEKCEAWCEEHHSCNLEIVSNAEENSRSKKL